MLPCGVPVSMEPGNHFVSHLFHSLFRLPWTGFHFGRFHLYTTVGKVLIDRVDQFTNTTRVAPWTRACHEIRVLPISHRLSGIPLNVSASLHQRVPITCTHFRSVL